MQPLHRCQVLPCSGEFEGEALELFEMEGRERLEALSTDFRELNANDSVVLGVPGARDQPSSVSTVDKADRAVVAQQEVVGHLADSGTAGVPMATDREEQLVLGGSQPGRLSLLLAPALEMPKARPQRQRRA